MRYNVKIFSGTSVSRLEKEANSWLEKQKDIHIQDIRFEFSLTQQGVQWNAVLILYKKGLVYTLSGTPKEG